VTLNKSFAKLDQMAPDLPTGLPE